MPCYSAYTNCHDAHRAARTPSKAEESKLRRIGVYCFTDNYNLAVVTKVERYCAEIKKHYTKM
jgi:uncharacterized Rmd1/YagE family protein